MAWQFVTGCTNDSLCNVAVLSTLGPTGASRGRSLPQILTPRRIVSPWIPQGMWSQGRNWKMVSPPLVGHLPRLDRGSLKHVVVPRVHRQILQDDNRRNTMAATIEAVCSRVSKERQKKLDKGVAVADLVQEFGSEEAHKKKECLKEVSDLEVWVLQISSMPLALFTVLRRNSV